MRVAEVLHLQAQGQFVNGITQQQLAEKWDCDLHTVSVAVTQAMRFLRLNLPTLEDEINHRIACIEEDRRIAKAKVKHFAHQGTVVEERPDPDVGAMLAADRLILETIGALTRVKSARDLLAEPENGADVVTLIRTELRANPALVRTMLDQMPAETRRELLLAASVVDVTQASEDVK